LKLGVKKGTHVSMVVDEPKDYSTFFKVLQITVWVLFFMSLVTAAWALMNRNAERQELAELVQAYESRLMAQEDFDKRYTASAIAESFVREYLEGSTDKNMTQRLEPFVVGHLSRMKTQSGSDSKIEVLNLFTWSSDRISDDQVNVTIKADVRYHQWITPEEEEAYEEITNKTVYVKVPLFYDGIDYVVDNLPSFLPAPQKATVAIPGVMSLRGASQEVSDSVEDTIKNFFNTYAKGNSLEISYYLKSGQKMNGFQGQFEFLSLNRCKVYNLESNKQLVLCDVRFKDPLSGATFTNGYHLHMSFTEGRWYIDDFDVRTEGLKAYLEEE